MPDNRVADILLTGLTALVFLALGAVFITESALLIVEYGERAALFGAYAAQEFVFFPLAGVGVLICFFPMTHRLVLRSAHRGWKGVAALAIVTVLVVGAGAFMAGRLSNGVNRSAWEVVPGARAAPDPDGTACTSARVFQAHRNLQSYAREHGDSQLFSGIATRCGAPQADASSLYCAASGATMKGAACCAAQNALVACTRRLAAAAPSRVAQIHPYALIADSIFLLGAFALGLQLAGARDIATGARPHLEERLVLCGAFLMALWPMLNLIYVESASSIYGSDSVYRRLTPIFNVAYASWAISIVSFFQSRFNAGTEWIWRIVTVGATTVGALNFNSIAQIFIQYMGPGAEVSEMGAFLLLYFVLAFQLASILLGSAEKAAPPAAE